VNADQVVLRYSAPPTGAGFPVMGSVVLDGVRSDYSASAVTQLDERTFAVTLNRPLGTDPAGAHGGDRVTLSVAGGAAGGTYRLTFNVLPGDVDNSGVVLAGDYSAVKARFFKNTNTPPTGANDYDPFFDVDGSGVILANDFSEVKKRFFDSLPPTAAAAGPREAPTITAQIFGAARVLG
jgi:hypothetical protein